MIVRGWRKGRRLRRRCSRSACWEPRENRSSRGGGRSRRYRCKRWWYASESGDDSTTVVAILQMDLEIIERFARTRVVKLYT